MQPLSFKKGLFDNEVMCNKMLQKPSLVLFFATSANIPPSHHPIAPSLYHSITQCFITPTVKWHGSCIHIV